MLRTLKAGDKIKSRESEWEVSSRVVEVLGAGETESGYDEPLRYKTALIGGSWANTTMIIGHNEVCSWIEEGEAEIERVK